jgi:mannose-1-phosphate guanylyltransferase
MVKFLILAGGKGERMAPYTDIIPKCLLPVGGIPCVRWIVDDILFQYGWRPEDIVLCINKKFERHFKHEFRDLPVRFSITEEPRGTGSEVMAASEFLGSDTFILRYGDDLTDIDYNLLLDFHRSKKALITLGLTSHVKLPVGVVVLNGLNGNRVVAIKEKPYLNRNAWMGVAIMEPDVLKYLKEDDDIAINLIPAVIMDRPDKVIGYVFDSEWYDVGNLEHWRQANEAYNNWAFPY